MTGGTFVQSLLFDRDLWTEEEAQAWAATHGFESSSVDEKPTTLRLRQVDPAECVYRTKAFGEDTGIKAVIETPRPHVLALMHKEVARRASGR